MIGFNNLLLSIILLLLSIILYPWVLYSTHWALRQKVKWLGFNNLLLSIILYTLGIILYPLGITPKRKMAWGVRLRGAFFIPSQLGIIPSS
jgi:predicted membrane channel-forming protein YqfA (hemolysin III family)